MAETAILPTFQSYSFEFGDEAIPEHVEAYPNTPNLIGSYSVYALVDMHKTYPLAIDIKDEATAIMLAAARARKQESDIGLYGYSDDVWVRYPDNSDSRLYLGRTL